MQTLRVFFLLFLAAINGPGLAQTNVDQLPVHALELEALGDREYRIVGPEIFLNAIREFEKPRKWYGCGVSIDWGDGTQRRHEIEFCSEMLKHRYSVSGTYTLSASIWHPGPTDAAVTTWVARNEISILPLPSPEAISLKLIEVPDPDDVIFAEGHFRVGVAIEIDQPSKIKMTLRDSSGQQISTSGRLLIETSADGRYDLVTWQYLDSAYEQITSGGTLPFQATIDLIQNGRVLRSMKTRWYRLSAEYDPSYWGKTWKIRPADAKSPPWNRVQRSNQS